MDSLLQDIRYSVRRLLKSPAFSLVIVLTLALGIGANTAIFSAVNAVLLRPLAYGAPERLVSIEHFYPSLDGLKAPVSVPGFRDYQARGRSFESMAVETRWAANLTGTGEPVRLTGARVSARFFGTLGVPALLGRGFLVGEDSAGREHVVVLSYDLWQRLFGGARGVVGRSLAPTASATRWSASCRANFTTSTTGASSCGRRSCFGPRSRATTGGPRSTSTS